MKKISIILFTLTLVLSCSTLSDKNIAIFKEKGEVKVIKSNSEDKKNQNTNLYSQNETKKEVERVIENNTKEDTKIINSFKNTKIVNADPEMEVIKVETPKEIIKDTEIVFTKDDLRLIEFIDKKVIEDTNQIKNNIKENIKYLRTKGIDLTPGEYLGKCYEVINKTKFNSLQMISARIRNELENRVK